jgi:hypothetical protein
MHMEQRVSFEVVVHLYCPFSKCDILPYLITLPALNCFLVVRKPDSAIHRIVIFMCFFITFYYMLQTHFLLW